MAGLGSVMKLMRGGFGPDELAEMLKAVGMDVNFAAKPVSADSFRPLASSASLPGSKLVELTGKMKDGGQLHALIVLNSGKLGKGVFAGEV